MRTRVLLFTACVALASAGALPRPATAESLFDPTKAELFTDDTARQVGDILTVVISESTSAKRGVKTDVDKAPKFTGGLLVNGFFDVLSGLNSKIEPISALDIDPHEEFQSEASTQASGSFTGRLTVIVREVLPNGNLMIEGVRSMQINKETETLSMQGVVRPRDIRPDNTVLSSEVADVTLDYTGKGVVSRSQKNGFLHKIFNFLF
ncbi:MAG: flagellar basal body L-ring protein FlgH [bacterium]